MNYKEALKLISKTVGKTKSDYMLTMVEIIADKDIVFITNNLTVSTKVSLPYEGEPFHTTVEYKSLAKIIKKNSKLSFSDGKLRVDNVLLTGHNFEEFPIVPTVNPEWRLTLPKEGFKEVLPSVSEEDNGRRVFTGVLVDYKGDLRYVATTLTALSFFRQPAIAPEICFVIPKDTIRAMIGFDKDFFAEVDNTSHLIHLTCDDGEITSLLIDGKFPSYESVLPLKGNILTFDGRGFTDIIKIASPFAENEKITVKLTLDNINITCKGDRGDFEQDMPSVSEDKTEVIFKLRIDDLKSLEPMNGKIEMLYNEELHPIKFSSGKLIVVLMPQRR